VFALCLLVGLSAAPDNAAAGRLDETEATYVYSPPEQLNDGWKVSTLEAESIDTETIELLTSRIQNNKYKHIYSMAIVKNGSLVHEAYFNGRDRETRIKMHSITKSVTSMLIGIAIESGLIGGLDETVMTYLPDYEEYVDDPRKNTITLEHILMLKTGWKWDEQSAIYDDPTNSHYWMEEADDWLRYVIEQPIENEPGEQFVYNTGAVHLLSGVIKNTTGIYADRYAEKVLFEPLGIKEYKWIKDVNGYPCTGGSNGGLCLNARDLAKIGLLVMRGGKRNGEQVVPKEWLDEAVRGRSQIGGIQKFGYLWWSGSFKIKGKKLDHIQASGYGGQLLHLVPELDLIVVFQSWSRDEGSDILAPLLMSCKAALVSSEE
jgi:CubicO group peptidase (beta-lactamase class C family)